MGFKDCLVRLEDIPGKANAGFESMRCVDCFIQSRDIPSVKITGISTGTEDDCVEEMIYIFGDRAQDAEVFSDYYSMLDTLKPDVVSIAGPLEKHSQMCIDAFELGIHVFCEKPVTTNLKELEK